MRTSDLPEYIEHFRSRVVQDALAEATAAYWMRRAEQFEWAKPTIADGHFGERDRDELNRKWYELDEIATACRNRASIALQTECPDRCCAITVEEQAELDRLHRAFDALANLGAVA